MLHLLRLVCGLYENGGHKGIRWWIKKDLL